VPQQFERRRVPEERRLVGGNGVDDLTAESVRQIRLGLIVKL
jgi:hypothetical protein